MPWLIDGYNLLHVMGLLGRPGAAGRLERSRQALLDLLADRLTPAERAATTIVFDARHAPPGLLREFPWRGLAVRFAPRQSDADELIEQLIQAVQNPRELTVVSSDRRLKQAARRRGAVAADSEPWFLELQRRPSDGTPVETSTATPPADRAAAHDRAAAAPVTDEELARWLAEFQTDPPLSEPRRHADRRSGSDPRPSPPSAPPAPPARPPREGEKPLDFGDADPFPPGYFDDLPEE